VAKEKSTEAVNALGRWLDVNNGNERGTDVSSADPKRKAVGVETKKCKRAKHFIGNWGCRKAETGRRRGRLSVNGALTDWGSKKNSTWGPRAERNEKEGEGGRGAASPLKEAAKRGIFYRIPNGKGPRPSRGKREGGRRKEEKGRGRKGP